MKGSSGAVVSVLGRQLVRPHIVESAVPEYGCKVEEVTTEKGKAGEGAVTLAEIVSHCVVMKH